MPSTWRCQYVNSKGEQCGGTALFRLHFAPDHPFDHVDVCNEHYGKYKYFAWFQRLVTPQEEKELKGERV